MQNIIKKLSDLRGASGHEGRINSEIADMFRPYCDEVRIDALGSVIAERKCGKENAPKVMLEAHMDEIGLVVKKITDEGYIYFSNLGGVDSRILPSSEVTIHGEKDVYGVVGMPPAVAFDEDKSYKIKDLAIDTGLDGDTVKALISVGDSITLPQSVGSLGKEQFSAKTMDDRASVAAILKVMENIKDADLNCDIYAVAAVQEEVGCRGAKVASFAKEPDIGIALDVTGWGDTPGTSIPEIKLGEGIGVKVMDRASISNPALREELIACAEKAGVKAQREVLPYGGTDAGAMQQSRGGIPVCTLSVPCRYVHSACEVIDMRDMDAGLKLLQKYFA